MQLQLDPLVNTHRGYGLDVSRPRAKGEAIKGLLRVFLLIHCAGVLVLFRRIEASGGKKHKDQDADAAQAGSPTDSLPVLVATRPAHESALRWNKSLPY